MLKYFIRCTIVAYKIYFWISQYSEKLEVLKNKIKEVQEYLLLAEEELVVSKTKEETLQSDINICLFKKQRMLVSLFMIFDIKITLLFSKSTTYKNTLITNSSKGKKWHSPGY